jgi:hypothetical protein
MNKKNFVIFFLIFILIRSIIYFYLNIEPVGKIFHHWQLLDKELLHNDLLESILYLHTQPFLWNLFIGFLTKIFDANEVYISNFLLIYHLALTTIFIYLINKIAVYYNLTNFRIYIINLFIILNPGIIFFENLPIYAHTIFFLFSLSVYFAFIYLKNKITKYLGLFYLCLLMLTFIWSAFNPILFIIVFIAFELITKDNKKVKRSIFIFFFLISLLPGLKNYIIFKNVSSSFIGYNLAMHIHPYISGNPCSLSPSPIKNEDEINYIKYYNQNFKIKHPSIIGPISKYNNIGMIYRSNVCKSLVLVFLIENPIIFTKILLTEFASFHGQWLIDFAIIEHPRGWDQIYEITKLFFKHDNFKVFKQIVNILFMFFIYYYLIKNIIFSKTNIINKNYQIIALILYFYIIGVGTVFSKYEGVRFFYSGYIIIILFLIEILSKKKLVRKNT